LAHNAQVAKDVCGRDQSEKSGRLHEAQNRPIQESLACASNHLQSWSETKALETSKHLFDLFRFGIFKWQHFLVKTKDERNSRKRAATDSNKLASRNARHGSE